MSKFQVTYKDSDRGVQDMQTKRYMDIYDVPGVSGEELRRLCPEYLTIEVDTDIDSVTVLKD